MRLSQKIYVSGQQAGKFDRRHQDVAANILVKLKMGLERNGPNETASFQRQQVGGTAHEQSRQP